MNNNIPPGYKQTEVGVIPEDWEVRRLKELFTIKSGFAFSSTYFSDKGPILLTPGNFKLEGGLYFNDRNTKRYCGPYSSSMLFDYGDLLIVMTDLTPDCNLLGKPAFARFHEPILHNQRIGKIVPNSSRVSLAFLYWFFLSAKHAARMKETATGSTVRHASNSSIYNSLIALPPTKAEQEAIAETLSDADTLTKSLEQFITKKRQLKQGAVQELLRPKTGWVEKRLGDVASFHKGKGLAKSELDPFGTEPCIHYGELFTKYPESIKRVHSRTNTRTGVFRSLANDVLMPTSDVTPNGLATASCILQDQVILGGDILVIRAPRNQLKGSFLSYRIRLSRDQVMQLVTGTTVYHLYGSDMKKFTFSMPGIEDQGAIVGTLDDMDVEIAALEEKLAKARQLKQGMMQELLTGRIRLV